MLNLEEILRQHFKAFVSELFVYFFLAVDRIEFDIIVDK